MISLCCRGQDHTMVVEYSYKHLAYHHNSIDVFFFLGGGGWSESGGKLYMWTGKWVKLQERTCRCESWGMLSKLTSKKSHLAS